MAIKVKHREGSRERERETFKMAGWGRSTERGVGTAHPPSPRAKQSKDPLSPAERKREREREREREGERETDRERERGRKLSAEMKPARTAAGARSHARRTFLPFGLVGRRDSASDATSLWSITTCGGPARGGGGNPPPALATKKILIRGAFPTSSSPLRLASPRLVGRSVQAQQPGNTYGLRLGSKGGGKEDRK